MLKLGCMSLSYKDEFAAGTLDLEGFLDRAREMRLDGVDLHTGSFASEEPDYLRSMRRRAVDHGLALSYIGVSSNFGVLDQEELDGQVAAAKHWIDVAAFMGDPPGAGVRRLDSRRGHRGGDVGADDPLPEGGRRPRPRAGCRRRPAQPQPRLRHADRKGRAAHHRGGGRPVFSPTSSTPGSTSVPRAPPGSAAGRIRRWISTARSPRPRRWPCTCAARSTASSPAPRSG